MTMRLGPLIASREPIFAPPPGIAHSDELNADQGSEQGRHTHGARRSRISWLCSTDTYRTENLELAALLRLLREGLGETQTQFATRIGRNQTYVSNVELGIRWLDLVELRDYCAGLNVHLVELIAQWEKQIQAGSKARTAESKRRIA